jgi:hypothetical protein
MLFSILLGQLLAAVAFFETVSAGVVSERGYKKIKPKVFIIDMVFMLQLHFKVPFLTSLVPS